MATYEEIMQAARNADAAGDEDAARRLVQMAIAAKGQGNQTTQPDANWRDSQPPEGMIANPQTGQMTSRELLANRPATRGEAAMVSGMRGLSLGGSDEIIGSVNRINVGQGGTGAERYEFGREYTRAREDAARRDFPGTSFVAEGAGGVGTALSYGMPAMAKRGLLGAIGAGAAVGGVEGAAYGALTGEGGAGNRARNAASMGLLGAGIGAAAPPVMSMAGKGARGLLDTISGGLDAAIGKGSQGRAARALAATADRAGMSADDVDAMLRQAASEGQAEFRVADALGQPGQRRLSGIARAGGDASAEIADFLNQRQVNQPERVAGFVEDAFDMRGSSAKAAQDTLKAGRKNSADIAFGGIRAQGDPVDIRPVLQEIDAMVAPFDGAGITSPAVKKLKTLRTQLAGNKGDADFELSDFNKVFAIRKALRDEVSAAYTAGRSELGSQLKAVQGAMDNALAASSDDYAQAMADYARSSKTIDAVESGQQMARPGQRAIDTGNTFRAMSGDQQSAARTGYGNEVLRKVESTAGDGSNRVRPLTSAKAVSEANEIAVDPQLLQRRVGRENVMFETRNRALGGSRTADNLEDMADIQGFDAGMIANLASGRWGAASQQAAGQIANVVTGMNPGTRKLVAESLMASNADGLREALKKAANAKERKLVLDAVMRIYTIQNTSGPNLGANR